MASFTYQTLIEAPIETVFEVVTDHRAYSVFTPLRSVTLEREGEPAPNGVGAIRVLRLAGPPIREEVTEYVPPTRFSYRLLSGIPVRDHRGTVELLRKDAHTEITWTTTSSPRVPAFLEPAALALVKLVIRILFNGITRRSEQLAGMRA